MADADYMVTYIDIDDDQEDASLQALQVEDLCEEDQDRVATLSEEIVSVDSQIKQLQTLRRTLASQRQKIFDAAQETLQANGNHRSVSTGIDYTTSSFKWSKSILNRARDVFGIKSFRSCQEAAINACMDGRDVILIMATGGGKSLVYQLPAVMAGPHKMTVVISPLISLMNDQAFHLQDLVEFEVLSGARSPAEIKAVLTRIRTGEGLDPQDRPINILFATPERVSNSKTFIAALQKCYERGELERIVIDEAHCCSQQGHDFRPDYRKLSILRKLFPKTPITCLTATCGPKILEDLLNVLGMPPVTSPDNAAPRRTVYLTSPLYRPNLIYQVVQRPSNAQDAVKSIAQWIQDNHPGECGIVYCLSRKDTVTMAESLREVSEGAVRTAVYNADLDDRDKTRVHVDWRNGKVQVICATIAFGMGIDKGDVRFVIHSVMSKSMDGFYQESGRAGRDGKDADCVLFYRPQDASRISSMVADQPAGYSKLLNMLEYAQSTRCRKLIFASYFEDQYATLEPCGRCDNCTSPIVEQDATWPAWQIVRIVDAVRRGSGRVTIANLVDLVRGNGGGRYQVVSGRKGKASSSSQTGGVVKLEDVSAGKVLVSKDNVERIVIDLLVGGYLSEDLQATAYSVNVYMTTGHNAIRFTRHEAAAARALIGLVRVSFIGGEILEDGMSKKGSKSRKSATSVSSKASRLPASAQDKQEQEEEWEGSGDNYDEAEASHAVPSGKKRGRASYPEEDSDGQGNDWEILAGKAKYQGRIAQANGSVSRKRSQPNTTSTTPIEVDSDS